jgi:predicted nuclease of restriction endonuclease-like (RecB) superfamily
VSPLVTQIQWSNHLVLLSRTKTIEEKMFYLQECCKNHYTKRELERQISTCLYERTMTTQPNISNALQDLHPCAKTIFRDLYTLDFLGLAPIHFEADLQKAIIQSLKQFIIEFGRDFAFIGEEFRLQVGMKDYFIDLLFYHRELQCLVAFELKVEEFKPEYIGKLSFYLEALDRDVRKKHEKPSIGIILCKGKDSEVVEYALARTTSPAVIAEYTTKLPDKKLLQSKLLEFFDTSLREMHAEYVVQPLDKHDQYRCLK